MKKNPYRILGIVFTSIAAVEVVVTICLLLSNNRTAWVVSLPFATQCIIFGGIGIGFLMYVKRKESRREELLANGYYEMATVVAIEQNTYVRVNRQSPYYVVCRIERDGVLHEYRSESQFHFPTLQSGDQVAVYLDRRDEKRYYVDLEGSSKPIIRH